MYLKTLEICVLKYVSAHFLSAPGLAWQAFFKRTKVKLDVLTNIDMLLMVEKSRGGEGICHPIYCYVKTNSKHMQHYDKNKESPYIQYWDVNNLYQWAMSQRLPVNDFKRVEDMYEFNEEFIKS